MKSSKYFGRERDVGHWLLEKRDLRVWVLLDLGVRTGPDKCKGSFRTFSGFDSGDDRNSETCWSNFRLFLNTLCYD